MPLPNPFKIASKSPVVAIPVNAHAKDNEALWKDIEKSFVETLTLVRSADSFAPSARASTCLTGYAWHQKIYAAATKSPYAAEYFYNKFLRFVDMDLQTNVTAPLMKMFRENSKTTTTTTSTTSADLNMFNAIGKHYEHFGVFRRFANMALTYLNSFYVQRNHKLSITASMNTSFYSQVYINVKDALATVVLLQVRKYRDGETVQMHALQSAIRMFAEIATIAPPSSTAAAASAHHDPPSTSLSKEERVESPLKKDLLDKYIAETGVYYSRAASEQMNSATKAQEFISWCCGRMKLEENLVKHLMPGVFWQQVEAKLFESMLAPFVERVVTHPLAGLRHLVMTQQLDALSEMHSLLRNIQPKGSQMMGNELQVLVESDITGVFGDYQEGLKAASSTGGGVAAGPAVAEAAKECELRLTVGLVSIWCRFGELVDTQLGSDKYIRAGISAAFVAKLNAKLEDVVVPTGNGAENGGREEGSSETTQPRRPSLGEIFAAHLDLLCRRELREASLDADGETRRMDIIVSLLMLMQERDVFQESHRAKLAKRLLQTTPNMEMESQVINKLQRSLGKTFTFKMEAMLRDFALTGELQRAFAAEQQNQAASTGNSNGELSVHVLTAAHWPAYRCDAMQPPKSLDACLRSFRHFYAKQHASRTISWVHTLGTAQLQVNFPKGVKDISCSVFQAAILLTVSSRAGRGGEPSTNSATTTTPAATAAATIGDLARALNLPSPVVKMHTASMYLHKVFTLLTLSDSNGNPCPPNKHMHDGDLLIINPNFVHKLRKFKLAAPVAAKREGEPGREDVEVLRKAQTDAAVVRVMKSRRTLMFHELEEQASQQLSKLFVPSPKLLKLRVEDLITRGYLRRDESDRNKFHYLA